MVVNDRVLIVGCGGLGGIVAGTLLEHAKSNEQPLDLTVLTTNARVADEVNARGFVLRGEGGAKTVPGKMVTALDPHDSFGTIILATQPPQVEDAARRVSPHLHESGKIVCLQNGLCEERVAHIAPREQIVGAVVAWGGAMPEPGVYDRTSSGGFSIGVLEEKGQDLSALALLLEPIGPVTITHNLAGARWSKLAINCAISTLGTLGGAPLGQLMLSLTVRRLALELMTEVVNVARAKRIALEKVSGTIDLDWIALTDAERRAIGSPGLLAKHSMLLAVGARYRRMRSSMLAAIERGRPPAVDFLNGEIVSHGKSQGISTPVNAHASDLVWQIARKERTPSMDTIRELAKRAKVSHEEMAS